MTGTRVAALATVAIVVLASGACGDPPLKFPAELTGETPADGSTGTSGPSPTSVPGESSTTATPTAATSETGSRP